MPDPIDPAAAEELVGLTVSEAQARATELGWTIRVVREDGVDLVATDDYSPTRVNVETTDDVVVRIVGIS